MSRPNTSCSQRNKFHQLMILSNQKIWQLKSISSTMVASTSAWVCSSEMLKMLWKREMGAGWLAFGNFSLFFIGLRVATSMLWLACDCKPQSWSLDPEGGSQLTWNRFASKKTVPGKRIERLAAGTVEQNFEGTNNSTWLLEHQQQKCGRDH